MLRETNLRHSTSHLASFGFGHPGLRNSLSILAMYTDRHVAGQKGMTSGGGWGIGEWESGGEGGDAFHVERGLRDTVTHDTVCTA